MAASSARQTMQEIFLSDLPESKVISQKGTATSDKLPARAYVCVCVMGL